jgi:hypothetical protein
MAFRTRLRLRSFPVRVISGHGFWWVGCLVLLISLTDSRLEAVELRLTLLSERILPPTAVSLFRWDSSSFGVLDATRMKILRYSVYDGRCVGETSLGGSADPKSGMIYPDQIIRHPDGWFVWVKRDGHVRVYEVTGHLRHEWQVHRTIFWANLLSSGELVLIMPAESLDYVEQVSYFLDGTKGRKAAGWLTTPVGHPEIGRYFSFEDSGLQASANFPFIRIAGQMRNFVAQLPSAQRARILRSLEVDGLPVPLGSGYRATTAPIPVVLWADESSNGAAWLLTNGGTLIRFSRTGTSAPTALPPAGQSYVSTAFAAFPHAVATLTREQTANGQSVHIRLWSFVFLSEASSGR